VNIRAAVADFLAALSPIYEIIVFTSSMKAYADKILDYIDYKKQWIHHRLYREHCINYEGNIYIKDLRVLGRDLKNIIIVDNAPYAFGSQLENGYPIIPFYDYKKDEEIKTLTSYLISVQNVDDIRLENRKKFKLVQLADLEIGKYIRYYMPGTSDITSADNILDLNAQNSEQGPKVTEKINASLCNFQEAMNSAFKK
jgi:CTD small phosphatase-like protein 2